MSDWAMGLGYVLWPALFLGGYWMGVFHERARIKKVLKRGKR